MVNTAPSCGIPSTGKTLICWTKSWGGSPKPCLGDGVQLLWGNARRIEIAHPGEKKSLGSCQFFAFQYLQQAYKKDGQGLFTKTCSERTRGMASTWKTVGLG